LAYPRGALVTDAKASTSPWVRPAPNVWVVPVSIALTRLGLSNGWRSRSSATLPETTAADADVPLMRR